LALARGLLRLLRIRNLEEEQSRTALESVMGELRQLQHAQAASIERARRGRRLVDTSARSGELPDRLAGLAEIHGSERLALALSPLILDAELEIAELRADYLAKRIERRQAETLIEEAETRDAAVAERRSQQSLDDWFSNRLHRRAALRRELATESAVEPPGNTDCGTAG
jgi:flagellar biosynthesis chaperone FliJ